MTADWNAYKQELEHFRAAIARLARTLAPSVENDVVFLAQLARSEIPQTELWPDPAAHIHLDKLQACLDDFWAAYRGLPEIGATGAWQKYLSTPPPLPQLQRRLLERASFVVLAHESHLEPAAARRLRSATFGDVSPNPGMEEEWHRLWGWPLPKAGPAPSRVRPNTR